MNWLFPRAFFDAPQVLNASVTPIPGSGSSPLQVVANIGIHSTYAVDYIDSTGDFVGVYIGASGEEVLRCIVGGGHNDRAWGVIPAFSRVSIRSMTASSITNGYLQCTFVGVGNI